MDPSLFILLGFLAIMYFVLIRPQQKRQKEHQQMLGSIGLDDDVITIGGLHGRVVEVADDHVDLEVTDDVVLRYQKNAIARVVTPELGEDLDDDLDADDVEEAETAQAEDSA